MALRILKVIVALFVAVLLAAGLYAAYVMVSYHRLDDNLALAVDSPAAPNEGGAPAIDLTLNPEMTVVSANLGFGAYNQAFDFFMDGGTGSVAASPEAVTKSIEGSAAAVKSLAPTFVLFQEVDIDGTRSYHINEYDLLRRQYPALWSVFCQNYDSRQQGRARHAFRLSRGRRHPPQPAHLRGPGQVPRPGPLLFHLPHSHLERRRPGAVQRASVGLRGR